MAVQFELATIPSGDSVVLRDLAANLGGSGATGGIWLLGVVEGVGQQIPFLFVTSYTSTPAPGSPRVYVSTVDGETGDAVYVAAQ